MAEHAVAAELDGEAVDEDVDVDVDVPEAAAKEGIRRWFSGPTGAVVLGAAIVAVLTGVVGWQGYRMYENRAATAEREMFLEAARQGVLNLTTMDAATIDDDIQRILDSTTGAFRDDFEARAVPFADAVRKAQSKSEGSITSAALASQDGDHAQVILTANVKMSNSGAQEQPPRIWRMRIEVQRTDDGAKVSNVQFVA
jgi:Mce-associated membrane protein